MRKRTKKRRQGPLPVVVYDDADECMGWGEVPTLDVTNVQVVGNVKLSSLW